MAKALGPEAAAAMRETAAKGGVSMVGEQWWSVGLPAFVKFLLSEKSTDEKYHAGLLAIAEAGRTKALKALTLWPPKVPLWTLSTRLPRSIQGARRSAACEARV